MALRVSVKFGKESKDLDFQQEIKLGELREEIEQQMSVPKAKQSLICHGQRWHGLAFADSLPVLEAAGRKGTRDVDGMKVVSVMLMAPAGIDGTEEVSRCEAQVKEAQDIVQKLPAASADETQKAALLAHDLLVKASQGLDCLELVGAQRARRRELLSQIEALEKDVDAKKR
ncbi:unnamed protein product [Effrenium voratum]|uniref:BAG domain-containing protein n=1 Tax=Effrenium voratum TaxID=2562239 RepID=A0AA36MS90_9DINO|nr:unnamed protein product [Effrenium voratum]CAJ1377267.1 unnamed protein product [Effrenium voratum]CAJ1421632.1 unnamed protein product [Effrenium voratum]